MQTFLLKFRAELYLFPGTHVVLLRLYSFGNPESTWTVEKLQKIYEQLKKLHESIFSEFLCLNRFPFCCFIVVDVIIYHKEFFVSF